MRIMLFAAYCHQIRSTALYSFGSGGISFVYVCIFVILAKSTDEKVTKRKDGRPVFSSNEVMKRKETFRDRLFDLAKQHHQVGAFSAVTV